MLIQFMILQVIVFSAVIYFMKRILSRDTQTAETRLNQVYEDLVEKQKQLAQKIEEAEKEYTTRKDEAAAIVDKMKKETQLALTEKEDKVLKEAKAQADEMVAKARASADELQKRIRKEEGAKLLDYVSNLVTACFTPSMLEVLHKVMVKEFVEKGDKLDFSNVSTDVTSMTIKTAMPLTDEEKKAIDDLVKAKIKREIQSEQKIEPKVVAGVVIEFGTLLLDGCFASAVNDANLSRKKQLEEED